MDRRPGGYLIGPESLPDGYETAVEGDPYRQLSALAEGLASSPAWDHMGPATMVLHPSPLLAILGWFTPGEEARLVGLHNQLAALRVRYVDWTEAEAAVHLLGDRLIGLLGEEIETASFLAIPRGGLIVLGMLAYLLGLRPDQLDRARPAGQPLVVVDDCSISGARFRQTLRSNDVGQAIFAHLYSTPQLRSAIEERERGVVCVSAHDLVDLAPSQHGDDYHEWLATWEKRSSGYWVGNAEHICFPWNEPDVGVWNPLGEVVEAGWRVIPPSLCLKNRAGPRRPPSIQTTPPEQGLLRPGPSVIAGELEEAVLIGDLDVGKVRVLEGSAAAMWRAATTEDTREGALTRLEALYEVPTERLAADFDEFIDGLVSVGMRRRSG